jgi:hypothetical protein
MITPAYSPTATERVLPRMALDFTTASLDSRVTITRALNTATAINSSGFIAVVNANLPRFDYNPTTLACNGLLIEEARTNPLLYSNEFTNIVWTATFGAVSLVSGTSPNGSSNVYKFIPSAINASFRELQQNIIVTAGTTYCFSQYVKADNYTFVQIIGSGAAFGTFNVNWDLSTGAETAFNAGTSTVVARGIINAGNGFYRVWVAVTALSTVSGRMAVNYIGTSTAARGAAWIADGVNGYQIYGAQLETGAFPTSYIPTTTTSLTRNADVVSMTGTNFSSWYNATQGTLYAEGNTFNAGPRATGSNPICLAGIYDGTASNRLLLTLINNTATQIAGRFVAGGTSLIAGLGASFTLGSVVKEAGSYISGNSAIYGNSVVAGTSAGAFTFTPNQLIFGAAPNGAAEYLCGWVRKVNFYNIALTQAQLAAITK